MGKLSDEELSDLIAEFSADAWAQSPSGRALSAMRELRELRALLATPMPCGWPVPELQPFRDGTCGVAWEPLDADTDADEAIALAAGLMRAALAAKGTSE